MELPRTRFARLGCHRKPSAPVREASCVVSFVGPNRAIFGPCVPSEHREGTPHAVERPQSHGLKQGILGRPRLEYISSRVSSMSRRGLSASRLICRSGWLCGINPSGLTMQIIETCSVPRPRIDEVDHGPTSLPRLASGKLRWRPEVRHHSFPDGAFFSGVLALGCTPIGA